MKQYIEWNVLGHTTRGYEDRVSDTVVVFFHGYTGHKTESGRLFYHLSDALAAEGISTIRFDWFGHGESDMEFVDIRVDTLQAQAFEVLNYAREQYKHVHLLGFSMGGAFAMHHVTADLDSLILFAPAYHIAGMKIHMFDGKTEDTIDLGGIVLNKAFLEGFQTMEMKTITKAYPGPILIVQGGNDKSVSQESSIALHESLPNSRLELFPDADHCFHNRNTHDDIADVLLKFVQTKAT